MSIALAIQVLQHFLAVTSAGNASLSLSASMLLIVQFMQACGLVHIWDT